MRPIPGKRGKGTLRKFYQSLQYFILLVSIVLVIGELSALSLLRSESSGPNTKSSPFSGFYSQNLKRHTAKNIAEFSAIEPYGLRVNNLQLIEQAGGALPEQKEGAPEDFLPVVSLDEPIHLQFRLRGVPGARVSAMKDISAYQILARVAHNTSSCATLWDSGKIAVNKAPKVIPWGGDNGDIETLGPGIIVKWKVLVWDFDGHGPAPSSWSKFAVGPDEWTAKWIVHPDDSKQFQESSNIIHQGSVSTGQCNEWKNRRPLPVARNSFRLTLEDQSKEIVSALLVATGLGSFSASMNGQPLSSSSPLDPSMMDYTKRISYRGFDVTAHFFNEGKQAEHVIGIRLGSGWWDTRPLNDKIVKTNLLPRGPLTTVAELHLVFSDGSTTVKIPTDESWQMAKGFLRDSDLYTGDTTDLSKLSVMEGWDSSAGSSKSSLEWKVAELYQSNVSYRDWRRALFSRATRERPNPPINVAIAPLGELVPSEAPPVLPIERIRADSVVNLGQGRWLYDFGKGFSGVLRFNKGLPVPIIPEGGYPRGHAVKSREGEAFVTVIYGDSITMETKDVNLIISAGLGYNADSPEQAKGMGGPCFPEDHGQHLLQRDVFLASSGDQKDDFDRARQSLFTTHSFRYAEVCCVENPPVDVTALAYRTAVEEWGQFDSSNIVLNGAYEMTRNAFASNMLGTQSDCPHREKLQYGGDLVADSPAALHLFDVSAFYSKIIRDWVDTQWENGAYTETSVWQALNDERGVGFIQSKQAGLGAGETVWASAPPVLTVRHAQHYGDTRLIKATLVPHIKWFNFLKTNFDAGMKEKYGKFGTELWKASGGEGLGDWLGLFNRNTWLTHYAFAMASARSIAFLANKIGGYEQVSADAYEYSETLRKQIIATHALEKGFGMTNHLDSTPGPDLALHAMILPGEKRCEALEEWMKLQIRSYPLTWPGDEERRFWERLNENDLKRFVKDGIVSVDIQNRGSENEKKIHRTLWKNQKGMGMGILAIRYTLSTLSSLGFHDVALSKASGEGFPGFEFMLSHNATTLWETWWRSEDMYSRNHPMLGAVVEWLSTAVAGVSLSPTSFGGDEISFWPRIPVTGGVVSHASASQGTKRGVASIAWKFVGDHSVRIRVAVPPATKSSLRLATAEGIKILLRSALTVPDIANARAQASEACTKRRQSRLGFPYNWEYINQTWFKVRNGKAIGTSCDSYLWNIEEDWSGYSHVYPSVEMKRGYDLELDLEPGVHEVLVEGWRSQNITTESRNQYCSDPRSYTWNIEDAVHLI